MFSNENIIDIRDDIYITCKNEQGFIAVFEKTND
jgi:hypothetical protein